MICIIMAIFNAVVAVLCLLAGVYCVKDGRTILGITDFILALMNFFCAIYRFI